jgi:hypothetical protein
MCGPELRSSWSWGVVAMAALTGCPDRTIDNLPLTTDKVERLHALVDDNSNVDILFVIDNSGSMAEEQAQLEVTFRRFIQVLTTVQGGLPSIHIGVVTSDMGAMGGATFDSCRGFGEAGKLRPLPNGQAFIEDLRGPTRGQRVTNYSGTLEAAFAGIVKPGTGGCDMEAHLMSMRRALDANELNRGFLRKDAYLAVIIVADEDDCSIRDDGSAGSAYFAQAGLHQVGTSLSCFRSSTSCDGPTDPNQLGPRTRCQPNEASPYHASVASMVSFLKSIKAEDHLIVAGIIGNPDKVSVYAGRMGTLDIEPSCRYPLPNPAPGGPTEQTARPGVRLESFIKSFANHLVSTICSDDLTQAVNDIARLIAGSVGSLCFNSTPAEPHQCEVLDVPPSAAGRPATPLAPCDAARANVPCWYIAKDLEHCQASPTQLAVWVERGGLAPPAQTEIHADCVTR